MTITYDLSTSIGKVRLLCSDKTGACFEDSEIQGFLTMEDNSVKRAAAQALDTIADSKVLTMKVYTSGDYSVDGAKMADALRKRANALRAQADDSDGSEMEITELEWEDLV